MPNDVNTLIASWRRTLTDLSPGQVEELEDHLRNEIAALQKHGLTEQEGFLIAAMRCGRPNELTEQFDQADQAVAWSRRLRWMVVGFLGCALVNGLVLQANNVLGAVLITRGVSLPVTIALRILSLTVLIAVVVALWHVWVRRQPTIVRAQPPRWLTSNWTLSIWVALMPWLSVGWIVLRSLLDRVVPTEQYGQFALSNQVTWYVLPFTMPLILLIIAIGLSRQTDSRGTQRTPRSTLGA